MLSSTAPTGSTDIVLPVLSHDLGWTLSWWEYLVSDPSSGSPQTFVTAQSQSVLRVVYWADAGQSIIVMINNRVALERSGLTTVLDQWAHLAILYDYLSGSLRLSINGVVGPASECICCSESSYCDVNPVSDFAVLPLSGVTLKNAVYGQYLDDVAYYPWVLSQEEMTQVYNTTLSGDLSSPTPQPTMEPTAAPTTVPLNTVSPTDGPLTDSPTPAPAPAAAQKLVVMPYNLTRNVSLTTPTSAGTVTPNVAMNVTNSASQSVDAVVFFRSVSGPLFRRDCDLDPAIFRPPVVVFQANSLDPPNFTVAIDTSSSATYTPNRALYFCIDGQWIKSSIVCNQSLTSTVLPTVLYDRVCHLTQVAGLDLVNDTTLCVGGGCSCLTDQHDYSLSYILPLWSTYAVSGAVSLVLSWIGHPFFHPIWPFALSSFVAMGLVFHLRSGGVTGTSWTLSGTELEETVWSLAGGAFILAIVDLAMRTRNVRYFLWMKEDDYGTRTYHSFCTRAANGLISYVPWALVTTSVVLLAGPAQVSDTIQIVRAACLLSASLAVHIFHDYSSYELRNTPLVERLLLCVALVGVQGWVWWDLMWKPCPY